MHNLEFILILVLGTLGLSVFGPFVFALSAPAGVFGGAFSRGVRQCRKEWRWLQIGELNFAWPQSWILLLVKAKSNQAILHKFWCWKVFSRQWWIENLQRYGLEKEFCGVTVAFFDFEYGYLLSLLVTWMFPFPPATSGLRKSRGGFDTQKRSASIVRTFLSTQKWNRITIGGINEFLRLCVLNFPTRRRRINLCRWTCVVVVAFDLRCCRPNSYIRVWCDQKQGDESWRCHVLAKVEGQISQHEITAMIMSNLVGDNDDAWSVTFTDMAISQHEITAMIMSNMVGDNDDAWSAAFTLWCELLIIVCFLADWNCPVAILCW